MRSKLIKPVVFMLLAAAFVNMLPLFAAHSLTSGSAIVQAQTRRRSRRAIRRRATAPTDTSLVPIGTELKVRLNETLSSTTNRVGDKFTATVINPSTYEGAKVHGHISTLHKSGRVEGRTTMGFAFDSIEMPDGRSGPMHGQLVRVYLADGQQVDEEGRVESESRGKQTLKRSGIGAVAGAVIGGIIGGGKGAAIGLIVGGAAGAGSIAIEGSKELKLESGTEMLLKVTSR
jgi:hypothetical protein